MFLEFGQQHERTALDLLISTLHRVCPGAMLRTVVVDNALDGQVAVELEHQIHRVSGDNTMHEFSGWDLAITWLERRYAPAPASIVVLANDTVIRTDKHDRVRDLPADRVAAASRGALVGWIDEYPRSVELFGLAIRQLIDTSLVLTEWRTLAALRPLARPPAEDVFADDWRRDLSRAVAAQRKLPRLPQDVLLRRSRRSGIRAWLVRAGTAAPSATSRRSS